MIAIANHPNHSPLSEKHTITGLDYIKKTNGWLLKRGYIAKYEILNLSRQSYTSCYNYYS